MNQYLVQWANGAFQIVTLECLKKDLDEYKITPPYLYRLIPGKHPERMWVMRIENKWMIGDMYRNMTEI